MAKIYYKVVRFGLQSATCGAVRYKVGEWVDCNSVVCPSDIIPDSRLFLFTDLEEARKFKDQNVQWDGQIYEAHAIGVMNMVPCLAFSLIKAYWASVNTFLTKHKKVNIDKLPSPNTYDFRSCVTAKRVKLIKEVT